MIDWDECVHREVSWWCRFKLSLAIAIPKLAILPTSQNRTLPDRCSDSSRTQPFKHQIFDSYLSSWNRVLWIAMTRIVLHCNKKLGRLLNSIIWFGFSFPLVQGITDLSFPVSDSVKSNSCFPNLLVQGKSDLSFPVSDVSDSVQSISCFLNFLVQIWSELSWLLAKAENKFTCF